MSAEEMHEAPKLSLLEELRQEHQQFVNQRDQTQVNLQQLIGAIYACELMIKKHEQQEASNTIANETNFEEENSLSEEHA